MSPQASVRLSPAALELLEVLYLAHTDVSTFHGEFRDWARVPADHSLEVLAIPGGGGRVGWIGPGPYVSSSEARRAIWADGSSRVRVEVTRAAEVIRAGVRNGNRWWYWDPVAAGGPDQGDMPAWLDPPLLCPARLLGLLRLEVTGSGARAGRRVRLARGVPRRAQPPDRNVWHDFEFDERHGTLLRHATVIDGECELIMEALDVRYDCGLNPGLFDPRAARTAGGEALSRGPDGGAE